MATLICRPTAKIAVPAARSASTAWKSPTRSLKHQRHVSLLESFYSRSVFRARSTTLGRSVDEYLWISSLANGLFGWDEFRHWRLHG